MYRRLSDFNKAAEEGNLTAEQFLFLMAIEQFKKANNKIYPTWTDVLEIGIQLQEKHPDIEPYSVRFTDLHRYITELPGFVGDPAGTTADTLPTPDTLPKPN